MAHILTSPGGGVQSYCSSRLPPYERGAEFGAAFPDRVRSTIDFYRDLLARCPRPDVDLAAGGARALVAIEAFSPAAAAEIRGIAEGADLPVDEVAGINARTELLARAAPDGVLECSTIVSAPAAGPVRGAQTWDWYSGMSDGWLLWSIPLPDGSSLSTVTEFGILGKIGVNDRGLGVLFSILHHTSDGGDRMGVPVHVLARAVLERAGDRRAAIAMLQTAAVSASTTLTLVDPSGATSAEAFPGGVGVIAPEGGWLVRSNHFLSREGEPGCRAHASGEGSFVRRRELSEKASAIAEGTDESLVGALHGHRPDGALCVHATPDSTTATLATIVIDPSGPRLSVWRGGPCGIRHT